MDITFNSDGSQVYVTNFDGNEITLFDMDVDTGTLRLQESLMTRLSPWSLALMQDEVPRQAKQKTLYVAGGTIGLARLGEPKFEFLSSLDGHGDALTVSPNGRFAYTLNTIDNIITTYSVDAQSGVMAPVPSGLVKTGKGPADMTIDINGWYLYVTNSSDATMSVYFLNQRTGVPEPVRGSPIMTGKRPVAVSLDPAARFAFVVNAESNNVSVYRHLNNVTPLIFEGRKYGSPFAAEKEPLALVVDPTGNYAYVANAGSDNVSVYHVHRKTGALAAIPGSPFRVGQRPVDLQVHPQGRWLYVINQNSSTLTIHRVEKEFGALANKMKTVSLPSKPEALWINSTGDQLYVMADKGWRLLRYSLEVKNGDLVLQSDQRLSQSINDLFVSD